MSSCIK